MCVCVCWIGEKTEPYFITATNLNETSKAKIQRRLFFLVIVVKVPFAREKTHYFLLNKISEIQNFFEFFSCIWYPNLGLVTR